MLNPRGPLTLIFSVPKRSSPLRKTAAYYNPPSLSDPERPTNRCSYPNTQPLPGARRSNETLLVVSPILLKKAPRQDTTESVRAWISKLPEYHNIDMFQFSEKYASAPSTPEDSPSSWKPRSRLRSWNVTPRRVIFIVLAVLSFMLLNSYLTLLGNRGVCNINLPFCWVLFHSPSGYSQPHRPSYLTQTIPYNASFIHNAAFQPPEPLPHRYPDTIDTFSTYKYRNTCNISSLDLHAPFAPLCSDRKSMITAMSSGGRIGNDAPYMPRGCDMRWFSTEEICEILSRFEKVIIIGDSMMRHVIGSINVLIRKDLGYGAVTDWNFSPEERSVGWWSVQKFGWYELTEWEFRKDCFCNYQFNVKACSIQGIFKTADVVKNDPSSLACPADTIDVMSKTAFFITPHYTSLY